MSHLSPADQERLGSDLRRRPAEAAAIEHSIATGEPILAGPMRIGNTGETFVYRRPIYLGDGTASPDRFWGFATIRIARDAVVCKLGACEQPAKFRQAMRLVVGQTPQPPFLGDAALFEPGNNAAQVAVRIPGGRFEMAAIPLVGWSAATGGRWIIWLVAIPLALAASGRLLLVFFGLATPMLRVWLGVLVILGGAILALLREDIAEGLRTFGLQHNEFVTPAIATLIAFAAAYTINAALSAFVWPQQPVGHVDSFATHGRRRTSVRR
jgi:sensor domain CHASE-containing protein